MLAGNTRQIHRRQVAGMKPPAAAADGSSASHPTKHRSNIPRRKRIPDHFSISSASSAGGATAEVTERPIHSSASSSCLQSEITVDASSNGRYLGSITRSLAKRQAITDLEPEAKKLKTGAEVSVSDSSCLESVAETDSAVQTETADSYRYSSFDLNFADSSEWEYSDEDCFTDDSSQDDLDPPSAMFSFFLQFSSLFLPSVSVGTDLKAQPAGSHDDCSQEVEVIAMAFEEEEDEESYSRLRGRERKEGAMGRDYIKEYGSTTDLSRLILDQRLLMVNWMIEHFKETEMQLETLFLGVSILDRFLDRGYFKNARHLQLSGLASITLAARIEENQLCNYVSRREFCVEKNVYSRREVIAMEWLVQEILNFHCFVPTIHNFLWFYLKAAKADEIVEELARYLSVLALLDHARLCFKPSTVAASLVILACLATDRDTSCHVVVETHVRTRNDDLPECLKTLEWLIKHAC